MSTIKTTFIQHPSAESPSIELNSDGTVALPLSDLEDLQNVSATATDGQALVYDANTSSWVAGDVSPDALDAAVITTGTLDTARISGSYTGITGTGALNAGSVTSGFGNVNIGTSTFTGGGAHTQRVTLTASNASYSIPTAARKPGVRVTVIGGGGGGGSTGQDLNNGVAGGAGGTSTFNAGGAGTVSAGGGAGGQRGLKGTGYVGGAGFRSSNGGSCGAVPQYRNTQGGGGDGGGGAIAVAYFDLTSITTAAVTIGGGGAGGAPADTFGSGSNGFAGGRGEVILEF